MSHVPVSQSLSSVSESQNINISEPECLRVSIYQFLRIFGPKNESCCSVCRVGKKMRSDPFCWVLCTLASRWMIGVTRRHACFTSREFSFWQNPSDAKKTFLIALLTHRRRTRAGRTGTNAKFFHFVHVSLKHIEATVWNKITSYWSPFYAINVALIYLYRPNQVH